MGRRKPSFRQAWRQYQNRDKLTHVYAVLKTAPSAEPITLLEAQTQLKVNGEATYLNGLITTARMMVERYLNRALITQTWTAYGDDWCELELAYPPLVSVTSVKYYGLDGNITTLDPDVFYWVDNRVEPGEIEFKYAVVRPFLQYGRPKAIEIEYIAGYGNTGASVPEPIKHAIKVLITDMYENRGQYVIGSIVNKIPSYITDLIHTYKIYDF